MIEGRSWQRPEMPLEEMGRGRGGRPYNILFQRGRRGSVDLTMEYLMF